MRRTYEDVIQKAAAEDESFRAELLKNPKAAIEKKIGGPLPEWINVKVVEETADTVYFVVPMTSAGLAAAAKSRLTPAQLATAATSTGSSWSTCGKELTCWCVTTSVCHSSAHTVHGSNCS
ncbi:MAG: NHLP leader peptide family RiPP precursor [Candidatus Sulfotelmatobacter sp.]